MYITNIYPSFCIFHQLPRGFPQLHASPLGGPRLFHHSLVQRWASGLGSGESCQGPGGQDGRALLISQGLEIWWLNHGNVKRWMGRLVVNVLMSGWWVMLNVIGVWYVFCWCLMVDVQSFGVWYVPLDVWLFDILSGWCQMVVTW